jgi:hypothetical protein
LIPNFLARTAGMEIIFFVVTVVVIDFFYTIILNCQCFLIFINIRLTCFVQSLACWWLATNLHLPIYFISFNQRQPSCYLLEAEQRGRVMTTPPPRTYLLQNVYVSALRVSTTCREHAGSHRAVN